MISSKVFNTCREFSRATLPYEEASNSFGYYIDIPNNWERYRSPEELVNFLGIHRTHSYSYDEIINDMGPLTPDELEWVKGFLSVMDTVRKMLSTTGFKVDLKHDVAETLYNWRMIHKFVDFPCRVLDFGAGSGRQGVAAMLHDPRMIYTAIDSVLGAYTIQNFVLSYISTLLPESNFTDYLDFQFAGLEKPDIAQAKPGDIFHIPGWLAEKQVPEMFYDVIIAAFVHNELSKYDFMRLIHVIEKSLAKDGVVFVRSEQYVRDYRDFMDSVDIHAIGMTETLKARDIVPVFCIKECGFLTTVFARKDSRWHKESMNNSQPEFTFSNIQRSIDLSTQAGVHFVERNVQTLVEKGLKPLIIGDGDQWFNRFFKPFLEKMNTPLLYTDASFQESSTDDLKKAIAAHKPDVVVFCSSWKNAVHEKRIKEEIMTDTEFPLRTQYWFPVAFLHTAMVGGPDPVFLKPLFGPEDVNGGVGQRKPLSFFQMKGQKS